MNRNTNFTPAIGSELFGTAVIKTHEVFLFIKTVMENGSSAEEAYLDMQLIDKLLHLKRLHIACHGYIKTTKAGYMRKGTSLYNAFENAIESHVIHQKEVKINENQTET